MKRLLTLLALLLPAPVALACAELEISRAWVREPPPGAPGTAAYFLIRNAGSQPVVLQGWSSPGFAHVMLHETVMNGERAEMRHQEALELAPGGAAELRPGGLHLMLMQPGAPLSAGQVVTVDFSCNGAPAQLSAPVQQEAPAQP